MGFDERATRGIGAGESLGRMDTGQRDGILSEGVSATWEESINPSTSTAQDNSKQIEGLGQAQDVATFGIAANDALESGTSAIAPQHEEIANALSENRAAMGFDDATAAASQLGNRVMESAPSELADERAVGEIAVREPEAMPQPSEIGFGKSGMEHAAFEPEHTDLGYTANAMPLLAPEADRTLSMLPIGSDDARYEASQLVSRYEPAEQGNVAAALEHAMHAANEQHGIGWASMGETMERGLWSTHEAANNGIPLQEMARQMEPFSGTRDAGDYLAWQLTGGSEQFHLPSQQVAYLPAPGPYDYQAGRYIEQQTGGVVSYQDAAQMFYVIRDPSTPGGGWNKGHQFIGEVNRVARLQGGDPLVELDRWMQTNAPTHARLLWNIHFKVANLES